MREVRYESGEDLEASLGMQIQKVRLSKNLDQVTVAERAGVSVRALRNLEAGRGSTLATFVRVLKALERTDLLTSLVETPTVNPLELLRKPAARQRASRPHKHKEGEA
jgi:transcriptional regulator with XRE-family HTH domain